MSAGAAGSTAPATSWSAAARFVSAQAASSAATAAAPAALTALQLQREGGVEKHDFDPRPGSLQCCHRSRPCVVGSTARKAKAVVEMEVLKFDPVQCCYVMARQIGSRQPRQKCRLADETSTSLCLSCRLMHLVASLRRMSAPGWLQGFDEQRHCARMHSSAAGRLIICTFTK